MHILHSKRGFVGGLPPTGALFVRYVCGCPKEVYVLVGCTSPTTNVDAADVMVLVSGYDSEQLTDDVGVRCLGKLWFVEGLFGSIEIRRLA